MGEKTVGQSSEEYLRLLGYVTEQEHGTVLEYAAVQRDTGVKMDTTGKNKLRRAILRSGREYSVMPTVGYKLADSGAVMGILSFKLMTIDNRVKSADRAQRHLQDAFLKELPEDQRKGVLFIGSIFGAIRLSAENGKRLYGKKPLQITQGNQKPILP